MTRQPHRQLSRWLTTAVLTTALTAVMASALTACTPGATAARTVAVRYLDLIATADAAHLAELWSLTAVDDHGGLRAAGELLPSAAERIDVIEVGDATPVQGERLADLPTYPNFDAEKMVQVSVRYRLAGAEHEAVLALAPRRHRPAGDPASWRVVQPLLGGLGFAGADTRLGIGPDVYVSGIRVMAYTDKGLGPLDIAYPGVYQAQLRADPYLASKSVSIVVTDGEHTDVPAIGLNGTPLARRLLQDQVMAMFTRCEDDVDDCPWGVSELSRELSRTEWNVDSWSFRLIDPPTGLTVATNHQAGDTVRYTGRFALDYADGSTRTIRFTATTPWRFDADPPVPRLLAANTAIEVIR